MSADVKYAITPQLLLGIAMTLVGLSTLGLVSFGVWIVLWPVALVLGGTHIVTQMLVGILEWCLNLALSPLGMARAMPLALVAWGGLLVWGALSAARPSATPDQENVHAS